MTNNKPRVLLAEDERNLADLYTMWLESDYSVVTTYSGKSAIQQLSPDLDVILLDRRMPDVSGDEVLNEVLKAGIDCQVAMVTAVEPEFDILEMGFDDYITKPIKEFEILELVEDLVALETYEGSVREFYQLASKRAALESSKSSDELEQSEEYASLVSDVEKAKQASSQAGEDLFDDNFTKLF
ncbi:MAG: response regulator [Halobacteriota archaeon]